MSSIEVDPKKCLCKIDGTNYPAVGFGTYVLTDETCTQAVKHAIEAGYRIIDTATMYKNLEAIGNALKTKDRRQIYLISKVWYDQQSPADLHKDFAFNLEQLQTNYLDAYLLHWPNSNIPIEKSLGAMNELQHAKKLRHIGLSNVTVNHLKRALEVNIPISWVQVEMNPNFYDDELLKFCKKHSIAIQAWSPLGRGTIYDNPLLSKIGEKHGKTPSQVALRWILQHGCIPIPASKNEKHIQENREMDFTLSETEMEELNQRAKKGTRTRFSKHGVTDEFDFSYEECWPRR